MHFKKNKKNLIPILLFFLFLVASLTLLFLKFWAPTLVSTEKDRAQLPAGVKLAVWDWNLQENPGLSLVALKDARVNLIFLDVNEYVDLHELPNIDERTAKISNYKKKLAEYINTANQYGIEVQAVAGDKNWSAPSHRYLTHVVLSFVIEFNKEYHGLGFSGIQYDIEPYNQTNFNAETQEAIMIDYLITIDEITSSFKMMQEGFQAANNLQLGFAIPYWFDGTHESLQKISWQGEDKYIYQHLLNKLNRVSNVYVVLMSYRNFAKGTDGTIEHVRDELSFIQSYMPRISVIVWQETSNVEPKKITFYNKDWDSLVEESNKIIQSLQTYSSLYGLAYNNSESFLDIYYSK